MNGAIGSYVKAASLGAATAQQHMAAVFRGPFLTSAGWLEALNHMPGGSVEILMKRTGGWWTRECFQALYIACWIHHPTEKGSYMIQLTAAQMTNVKDAYDQLLRTGALESRVSSHLSKTGASGHKGWNFLNGYEELLIQVEGQGTNTPYLFLKCEGHPMDGAISTLQHGLSWIEKKRTGKGATASPALHEWAQFAGSVEERAAENYSNEYKALLKQLGLTGKTVTVEQVVNALYQKAGSPSQQGLNQGILNQVRGNAQSLGRAMLAQPGILTALWPLAPILKQNKVDYTDKVHQELRGLATRMMATATPHVEQVFNEIRATPAELDQSLQAFRGYIV